MKTLMSALPLSAAGAAIAVASLAMPTHALAVFGNQLYTTNPISNNSSGINNTAAPNPQQKAVSFRTDSRAWTLNSVVLSLGQLDSADTPSIEIRADDGIGNPAATALFTLSNPALTDLVGDNDDFTFTATGGFNLAADTNYWLVVTGRSYAWLRVGSGTLPSQTPAALNSSGWTSPSGYKFTGEGSPTWGAGNGIRNAFQIDATEIAPVPFAFTPIPGLIVSGIIGAARRARKSRNAEGLAKA